MATTLVNASFTNTPAFFEPVKSATYFRAISIPSTAVDLPGFRYVMDVSVWGTSSTGWSATPSRVARINVPAQPLDGAGIFSPHRILEARFKPKPYPKTNTITWNTEMAGRYKLGLGVGYDPEWVGTSLRRGPTVSSEAAWNAAKKPDGVTYSSTTTYYYAEIANSTTPHFLTIGEINLSLDNSFHLPYMNGKHSVTAISFTTTPFTVNTLILNTIYSPSNWGPGVLPGTASDIPYISYVDDFVKISTESSPLATFYAARNAEELGVDYVNTRQYIPLNVATYSTSAFLSKWPHQMKWKPVWRDELETIDFINTGGWDIKEFKVVVYDNTFTELGTRYIDFSDSFNVNLKTWYWYSVQVGYNKLMSQAIPSAVDAFPTAKYYTIQLGTGNAAPSSQHGIAARYEIVDRPCNETDFNTRLCWLNNKGGWDYFNFTEIGSREISVSKTEWRKQQPWNRTIEDRSRSVFSSVATERGTAVSPPLSEHEYNFLQDIAYSKEVYKVKEDGTLVPIVIDMPLFREMNVYRDSVLEITIPYKENTNIIV